MTLEANLVASSFCCIETFQAIVTTPLPFAWLSPLIASAAGLTTNQSLAYLAIALVLIALNGFFVAAEFALVKVRISQLDKLVAEGKMFAKPARWLAGRLDHSLSACQLGITMASLALGYVGEPAFAFLIRPFFEWAGVSKIWINIFAFIFAFSVILSLIHI